MVSTQHLFFGLHIADWLGGLQQKELRENDGGEPVIEGSWTNNVAAVSKSSPSWVLPTIWLSQPNSHHYYTGDYFSSSILKYDLDVVILANKIFTIPLINKQLNGIKRGAYFGRPPVTLAKVSKKYAGIMWKMGADMR